MCYVLCVMYYISYIMFWFWGQLMESDIADLKTSIQIYQRFLFVIRHESLRIIFPHNYAERGCAACSTAWMVSQIARATLFFPSFIVPACQLLPFILNVSIFMSGSFHNRCSRRILQMFITVVLRTIQGCHISANTGKPDIADLVLQII